MICINLIFNFNKIRAQVRFSDLIVPWWCVRNTLLDNVQMLNTQILLNRQMKRNTRTVEHLRCVARKHRQLHSRLTAYPSFRRNTNLDLTSNSCTPRKTPETVTMKKWYNVCYRLLLPWNYLIPQYSRREWALFLLVHLRAAIRMMLQTTLTRGWIPG